MDWKISHKIRDEEGQGNTFAIDDDQLKTIMETNPNRNAQDIAQLRYVA